jgi:hypothetical protein
MSNTLMAEGLDEAVIGLATLPDREERVVVYDLSLCADLMMKRAEKAGFEDYTRKDALEFLDFNVVSAWMGPGTPIFIDRCGAEEAELLLELSGGASRTRILNTGAYRLGKE